MRIATRRNLGWLDQVKWQVSHTPQERDFTGVRNRRLANGQNDRLDFLLNYKEKFTEGDIQMNSSFKTFIATHKLTYGAYASVADTDYQRRDVTTNLTTGVVTVANAGGFNFADATTYRVDGFLQDEILLFNDKLSLTPGVRYATYDLDPRPNPFYVVKPGNEPKQIQSEKLVKQFGAVYKATDNISLVGRYAEGFKMPTSQQLYTSLPNVGVNQDLVPNPRLRPEQVKSYEAGIRGQFSKGYFSATVFKADYTDFIQNFVPVPSVNFPGLDDLTYQNLSSVKLWGVELAGEFRFHENWTASASIAYTEGKQRFDATESRRRVRRHDAVFGRVRPALQRSAARVRCAADIDLGQRRAVAQLAAALSARRIHRVRRHRRLGAAVGAGTDIARFDPEPRRHAILRIAQRYDHLQHRADHGGCHNKSARTEDCARPNLQGRRQLRILKHRFG